ncbi:MAG: Na+/H+ antiporter NhaC family protein [Bacillota bacterium]|nr:Na+/H+ antiporter NhaC family protein [Bacillota bacterium]
MKFKIYLLLFVTALLTAIAFGIHIVYPLVFGLLIFSLDAFLKGFSFKEWLSMLKDGAKTVKNLILIFTLIGFLTASWRLSGTIQYLVYNGANLINPKLFYLYAFVLTLIMSMLIGSINGTITTMGIVIISLARANAASLLITSGAILSGGIFGDRISPVSSSAYLVAELTETDVIENRKIMFRSIIVPTIISGLIFLLLSIFKGGSSIDTKLLSELSQSTKLSVYSLVPALLIVFLALAKFSTKSLLIISSLASVIIAYFVQGFGIKEIIEGLIFGVNIPNLSPNLSTIVNSGGLQSMFLTIICVLLSAMYYGIFKKTDFLKPVKNIIENLEKKIGTYWTFVTISFLFSILFGTQAIVVMLITSLYKDKIPDKKELMLDLENGPIIIPSLIPWNMAAFLAFSIYQVPFRAVVFNVFAIITVIYYKKFKK